MRNGAEGRDCRGNRCGISFPRQGNPKDIAPQSPTLRPAREISRYVPRNNRALDKSLGKYSMAWLNEQSNLPRNWGLGVVARR